ncbi:hypothetical protein B296_00047204 [Ensete ventricosum]|uniref:Uncharacterized protein n=1 Tax=Ensete ventricosum TaxID=4639 RepID=A0A426Z0P4_ENSVE|nr:hypothetical protein B296_00047204 [Ensete ventricosum]
MDRPLPGGSAKNRPSAVDFGRWQPIEGEIDRRRIPSARAPLPPVNRQRPCAVAACGSRALFLLRGEKD